MTRLALLLVGLSVAALPLVAQQSDAPRFEVGSIKARTADDTTQFWVSFEPGRFVTVNAPLTMWLGQVYPTQSGRIEGRPPWLGTRGFDINAKAEGEPSREQMLEMLRSLLRDRFKFASHYEERQEDTFALVYNHPQRVLGPQLRRVDVDCAARVAAEKSGNPPPPMPNAPNGMPVCRTLNISGSLTSGGMTMSAIASALTLGAGPTRPVVDKTELSGYYEVTLKYFDGPPEARGVNDQPDFFTAVREQLGLRLDSQKSPVRVLVIDSIQLPTPD